MTSPKRRQERRVPDSAPAMHIVHYELLTSMDGNPVSLGAQRAVETLPGDATGRLFECPEIRTDNGSGYVSREFREVLAEHELALQRIAELTVHLES